MAEEWDEPAMTGQLAGIIAMMSALVKTLPPTARARLKRQLHVEFESLLSAMSAAGDPDVQAERNGVEWMRDLFLKRIEQMDPKQKARRIRKGKADRARRPAPDDPPPVLDHRPSTTVDFEL